jgi:threonine/homoserine/homoserine lactone efflux protein
MQAVESFTPVKSFGLGAALAALNPKNLLLIVRAGVSIAQANLGAAESWVVLVVFTILGSVAIVGPVIYNLLAGSAAERQLTPLKTWLIQNNATVMTVFVPRLRDHPHWSRVWWG